LAVLLVANVVPRPPWKADRPDRFPPTRVYGFPLVYRATGVDRLFTILLYRTSGEPAPTPEEEQEELYVQQFGRPKGEWFYPGASAANIAGALVAFLGCLHAGRVRGRDNRSAQEPGPVPLPPTDITATPGQPPSPTGITATPRRLPSPTGITATLEPLPHRPL
jgi:hypothetical protein